MVVVELRTGVQCTTVPLSTDTSEVPTPDEIEPAKAKYAGGFPVNVPSTLSSGRNARLVSGSQVGEPALRHCVIASRGMIAFGRLPWRR